MTIALNSFQNGVQGLVLASAYTSGTYNSAGFVLNFGASLFEDRGRAK